jgi:predicted dehydrogenase
VTKRLRIGIIGAGWPGQQHARAILAGKAAVIEALAEPNDERMAEFIRIYSPKKVYRDYGNLLGNRQVDAVIICLPNHLHFPATLAALRAHKHVLCEKPPALNGAEMRVLQEEAEKRGLVYFFSRQFRFTPAMRLARDLISREELGIIYLAEAVWVRSRGIPSGLDWAVGSRRRNAPAAAR